MARIGIMGGTFDPIHNGHLLLGKQAHTEYGLDRIWYMPSGQPPHKKDHRVTDAEDRCAMVKLAVGRISYFQFSDFEVSRPGNTYTAQTLALLKESFPDDTFYFIIGADSLYEIERWYHPEEVLAAVKILVAGREYSKEHRSIDEQIAYLSAKYPCSIQKLHSAEVDISSEEIRRMAGSKKDISRMVPKEVADYIRSHQLYQSLQEVSS